VELMVALTIGVFMLSGAAAAYLRARDARAALDATARLQEIARYAMTVIEADVRMAGYWGLTNRSDAITANPSLAFPAKCGGPSWVTDARQFIGGVNGAYLSLPGCAALSGGAKAGTDVLVVRRASAQRITPQRPTVASPNQDRVLVITDHETGQIFVPRDIGNAIPPGYAGSDPADQAPLADTRALSVNAYYVSTGSSAATDYPALRRKTLTAGPDVGDEEVIAGVEDLQFEVGLDTNGDGNADAFGSPDALATAAMPISIRVWLLVRAQERNVAHVGQLIPTYAGKPARMTTDPHLRLLASKTIQVRNTLL
jgi:type IV pilus assembly protein PilW